MHQAPSFCLPAVTRVVLALCLVLAGGGCTSAGRAAGPSEAEIARLRQVRVLLYRAGDPVTVAVAGPYRMFSYQPVRLLAEGKYLRPSLLRADADGVHLILAGAKLPQRVLLVPEEDGTAQVGVRRYRGRLILSRRSDTLEVINVLDIEDYLKGVLAGELPERFHIEAYKAQAVAARTYALYQKFTVGRRRHYDVTATQASQVYIGVAGETPKARAAVEQTYGRILTWSSPQGEKIFCAYYHSTCGGVTQSVANLLPVRAIPPLAGGVRCGACSHSRYFRWGPVSVSKQAVTDTLRRRWDLFNRLGRIEHIVPIKTTPEGRLVWLRLIDDRGVAVRMRAEQFRLAVGSTVMRSTWCRILERPDEFVFTDGRGFGHGVGMCQYGADGLARSGWDWRRILLHYYPGCHITKAY